MRYTIDSTHGLYAAADTADQAVAVLRAHLEDHRGEPDITYLIVAPGGQTTQGTITAWNADAGDAAELIDWLLDGAAAELTATTSHR